MTCARILTVLVAVATFAGTASAQTSVARPALAELRSGLMLRTVDGRQLGAINRLESASSSAQETASVIVDGRFVHIPTATISTSPKGAVTSLSLAEVRKLN